MISDPASARMSLVLPREEQEAERKRVEAAGIADFQRIVAQGISQQFPASYLAEGFRVFLLQLLEIRNVLPAGLREFGVLLCGFLRFRVPKLPARTAVKP